MPDQALFDIWIALPSGTSAIAPIAAFAPAFGNRNIPTLGELTLGGFGASQDARHVMTPLSAGNAFLIVAIMSVTFLTEVAVFILVGLF